LVTTIVHVSGPPAMVTGAFGVLVTARSATTVAFAVTDARSFAGLGSTAVLVCRAAVLAMVPTWLTCAVIDRISVTVAGIAPRVQMPEVAS